MGSAVLLTSARAQGFACVASPEILLMIKHVIMSTLKNWTALLIFASLVLESESSRTNNFTRAIEIQDENDLVAFTMQRNKVTYIICEGFKKVHEGSCRQLSRHCNLKVVKHTTDKANKLSSCPIDIEIDQNAEIERVPTARVAHISENDVVVFWADMAKSDQLINLRLVNIHLPNCSQRSGRTIMWDVQYIEIRHVMEQLVIVTESKTYEVVYDNKETCKKACSLIFNDEGSRIVSPIEANFTRIVKESGDVVFPARFGSDLLAPGSCILLSSEERLNASMIFKEKVFALLGFDLGVTRRPSISTAHEVLTVCKQELYKTKFLNCSRGNMNKWFNLTLDSKFQNSLVRNSRDGGLLTLTVVKKEIERRYFALRLSVFYPDGRLRGVRDVTELQCFDGLLYCSYVDLYENENNEVCLSVFRKVELVDIQSEEHFNWLKPRMKKSEIIQACYAM